MSQHAITCHRGTLGTGVFHRYDKHREEILKGGECIDHFCFNAHVPLSVVDFLQLALTIKMTA